MAGQGAFYIKIKDGFECLLEDKVTGQNIDGDPAANSSAPKSSDDEQISYSVWERGKTNGFNLA